MRVKKEIYNSFEYSISRAKALLALQDGIDLLLDIQEADSLIGYAKDKFKSATPLIEVVEEAFIEPAKQKMEELGQELEKDKLVFAKLEEKVSKIDPRELERTFKPLIEIIQSVMMVYDDPLYYEAVVSSITAFETYLKDAIVYLVSNNKKVEARFSNVLKERLDYEKIKHYDYDINHIMGYIVTETIDFYELSGVERAYRDALGKKKNEKFKIFSSEVQKKKLQNFIRLRHLIVHNGGFVDHKFRKETKCKYKIGEPYPLTKKYVENMIGSMIKVVNNITEEIKKA